MKKRIGINGIILFVTFLALICFHSVFFRKPNSCVLDIVVKICGFMLVVLGQIIRVSARGFKAENSRQGSILLQNGPYAFTRNPMYLGILLIGLGIIIMFFKWWVAILFVLIFIQRYLTLMFAEEKKLNALFPAEYADYQKSVPRLFPGIISLFKHKPGEILPLKKSWFRKEISSMLAVISAIIIIWVWKCAW